MIQRGEHPRLALEARQAVGIPRERVRQELDRDIASELRVPRPIDFAHAAGSEGGDNLVRAKARACGEGQTLLVDYTGAATAPTESLL